jgi:hypothetical protein
MTAALKILKLVWPYLLAALDPSAAVWYVEGFASILRRASRHEEKLNRLSDRTGRCRRTVSNLAAERDSVLKACEERVRLKDRTLASICRIDSIEVKGDTNEKDAPDGGDPLLGLLDGMFPPG